MKSWLPIHHEYWQQCLDLLAAHVPASNADSLESVEETPTAASVEVARSDIQELDSVVEVLESPDSESNIEAPVAEELEVDLRSPSVSSEIVSEESVCEEELTVGPSEESALEVLQPEDSTTAIFFAALPWNGEAKTPLIAGSPIESVGQAGPRTEGTNISITGDELSIETAKGFFLKVPWDGSTDDASDEIESVHVSAAYSDDGLDPRSGAFESGNLLSAGLMSAARTSDRIEKRQAKTPLSTSSTTKHYFSAIPWNN